LTQAYNAKFHLPGEMIVGPTQALFMDEISSGLDSSTTFQIVTCLQQLVHITDSTALISLLQPAPETFNLFDDVILMAEGKIVYHGPCSHALQFFEDCGFKCPQRKGAADFLQEVREAALILLISCTAPKFRLLFLS
jgi:ABC-type multidrug transport system ATPase subunit